MEPVFAFLHGHNVLVGNSAILPQQRAATFERQPDAAVDVVACPRHNERENKDKRNDGDEDHSDHDALVLAVICDVSYEYRRARHRETRQQSYAASHSKGPMVLSYRRCL